MAISLAKMIGSFEIFYIYIRCDGVKEPLPGLYGNHSSRANNLNRISHQFHTQGMFKIKFG